MTRGVALLLVLTAVGCSGARPCATELSLYSEGSKFTRGVGGSIGAELVFDLTGTVCPNVAKRMREKIERKAREYRGE